MLRVIITSLAVFICLSLSAQTELSMGAQFGEQNIDEITEWVQEGFTLTPGMGENPKEKVPCYKSKNEEVRLYALNTLRIKAPKDMSITEMVFTLSKQGVEEQALISASTGVLLSQEIGSKYVSWTGDANEVVFTVGETNSLHPEGVADGSGQLDFTSITITTKNILTGISEISFTDSQYDTPIYFDMTGRRIATPSKGIYICKQGNKVSKINIR